MARSPTALAALALLALLCVASASEFSHPSVVTLTSDNYDDMVRCLGRCLALHGCLG